MNKWKFIRGLILYGRFIQAIFYYLNFNSLNKKVVEIGEGANNFGAETIFTKFERNEQKVVYGQSLSLAQKNKIEKLLLIYPETTVDGLIIGRYINKEGNIKFNPLKEYALAALATLTIILILIRLIGLIIIIVTTSASFIIKLFLILLFTIPLLAYCYATGMLVLYPLNSYLKFSVR